MATAIGVECEIRVYANAATPRRTAAPFTVVDTVGNQVTAGIGDSAGAAPEGENTLPSLSWLPATDEGPRIFTEINNLSFLRFRPQGVLHEEVSFAEPGANDVAGFVITPRIVDLDCKIGTTALDSTHTDLHWTKIQGTWNTMQRHATEATKIQHTGSDLTARAQTVGNIDANRSLRFVLRFLAHRGGSPQAGFRIIWGLDYSLLFRDGMKPVVCRMVNGVWVVWAPLDRVAPSNMSRGHHIVRIWRSFGYLVVSIDHIHQWFSIAKTQPGQAPAQHQDVAWQAAPLQVNCFNVRVSVGVSLIKWADPADTPFQGDYTRYIPRSTPVDASALQASVVSAGWKPAADSITIKATVPDNASVAYQCTLKATAHGIDSPGIQSVILHVDPTWTGKGEDYINLRCAYKKLKVNLATPPILPNPEATVEIDRGALDRLIPNWQGYVNEHYPMVDIFAWRIFDDRSEEAPRHLFSGYLWTDPRVAAGFNDRQMTLTCKGPMVRLMAPAGIIDYHDHPMDYLYAIKAATDPKAQLWGSECVQAILDSKLGYEQRLLVKLPRGHYPILASDGAGFVQVQLAATGQKLHFPTFPPPFKRDGVSWIHDPFCKYDRALFFYSWDGSPSNGLPPRPTYGRLQEIIGSNPSIKEIPDAVYIDGDQNKLMQRLSIERKPERDINRVWALGNIAGSQPPTGLRPAWIMGEDRLDVGDPRAQELSWERTLVVLDEYAYLRGQNGVNGAQMSATEITRLIKYVQMLWPQITMRADFDMQWGDVVHPKLQGAASDPSVIPAFGNYGPYSGTYRVETVEHNIQPFEFTTQLGIRPRNAEGF